MNSRAYITTSWDDGHPLDSRVADLLAKYTLQGTFYIPMSAEKTTLTAPQIRELSRAFEIGAHTLHHVDLTSAPAQEAVREIGDSKFWIEDVVGQKCPMFCPPKGRYSRRHLRLIQQAGYTGLRGVELLSVRFPRPSAGLWLLPTTIQAYSHGIMAYSRNMIRRAAIGNFWQYLTHGRSTDWVKLARCFLSRVLAHGGVFHLWGHSWEIEETGQWHRLEDVFRLMSDFTSRAPALTNFQVCQAATVSP